MKPNLTTFSQIYMNTEKLLVQLSVKDLTDLIATSVSSELQKFEKLFKPISKDSEQETLLSRKETSELLKLSYTSLWKLNCNGILKTKKIGSRVLYLRSDVFNQLNKAS
jgi:hypothetical protein